MTTIDAVDPRLLLARVREYLPPERVTLVERAFHYAAEKHAPQTRKSGEPYIVHPLDAAMTVAGLRMDANAVAAALLHDVQEDCGVSPEELTRVFNAEVARLVDGATKLDTIKLRPDKPTGVDTENLRRMFLAMAEDVRVVIIKLADRLHNMRTLDAMSEDHRKRKARETMEIYAPLANRLGIWQMKWELEDLSFRHLQPETYREIAQLVASKRASRERYIAQVEHILNAEFERQGLAAEVTGRAKHIYSIYQKMRKYAAQGKSFSEIYDLLALRVLVNTVADCYHALGIVHSLWHPMPHQFDDYIASPKESGYQSLHTTVLCLGARPLEVQIRTYEMHRIAEHGVAAHWQYKEGKGSTKNAEQSVSWLRQLLDWQRDMSSSEEFVESVQKDLFQDQVYVFTPRGDVKDLPTGATPLDFAYRVHTDLGHRCIGAKVNGRLVALNSTLKNGDIVEIISSRQARGPSRDWLNQNLGFIKTTHARQKIRQWFKRAARQENLEKGREQVERELRRLGLALSDWQEELRKHLHFESAEDFFAAVGDGSVGSDRITRTLAPLLEDGKHADAIQPRAPQNPAARNKVQVLGSGDLLTQVAACCSPVPGDPIIGYVTRSRGVSIHHRECVNIRHSEEKERLVDVAWGQETRSFPVSVRVEAFDRVGLLRDLSAIVADDGVNITGAYTRDHDDHTIFVYLTVETTGVEQLTRLMSHLEMVRGVINVTRSREGNSRAAS
jgi:GTP diphosphokinase / guanosine-3',5'-bis(diphosphate) 3'-diphosphatase